MKRSNSRNYLAVVLCLVAGLLSHVGVANSGELLPLTDFYDTPESFAATGRPGDLIRSMEFDGYKLPPGVRATRILYGSTNSQGRLVASSGVVLIPPGEPPEGGWPIIAWAHGTSGVNRRCAPSLMVECFSDYRAPIIYLKEGYAVVATDYAGLGSDYPFDYLDRISNGWDVINSVKAARQAVPELGRKWLGVGHSAGAHAMRGVAELQASINDTSYLGVVSLSGLNNARDAMVVLSRFAPQLALYICVSVKARYPDFDYADVLTEKGMRLLDRAKTACEGPGVGRPKPSPIRGSEALKKDWHLNPYIDKYFKQDETGQETYAGPALVLIGEKELSFTKLGDSEVARRMCQQGVDVQLKFIPGANHGTLLGKSIADQMAWIAGRFKGRDIPSNCETMVK
ncbi:MAG: hypothetical protein JRJ29_21430 [Deltaproteobacteria bacterium]|nr:hypothetical protein [Deltaproteobacteria bacterium]